MPDLETLLKMGGSAAVLAAVVAHLYKKREATHQERIDSYKQVVKSLENRIDTLVAQNQDLYERLVKKDED